MRCLGVWGRHHIFTGRCINGHVRKECHGSQWEWRTVKECDGDDWQSVHNWKQWPTFKTIMPFTMQQWRRIWRRWTATLRGFPSCMHVVSMLRLYVEMVDQLKVNQFSRPTLPLSEELVCGLWRIWVRCGWEQTCKAIHGIGEGKGSFHVLLKEDYLGHHGEFGAERAHLRCCNWQIYPECGGPNTKVMMYFPNWNNSECMVMMLCILLIHRTVIVIE